MARNTLQKQIVYDAMKNINKHPTATQLYDRISKEYPNISKATVFRILKHGVKEGRLMEVVVNDGQAHYELKNPPHYHVRCKECGKICDAPIAYKKVLDELSVDGFLIEGHSIEFHGICNDCLKERTEKK